MMGGAWDGKNGWDYVMVSYGIFGFAFSKVLADILEILVDTPEGINGLLAFFFGSN